MPDRRCPYINPESGRGRGAGTSRVVRLRHDRSMLRLSRWLSRSYRGAMAANMPRIRISRLSRNSGIARSWVQADPTRIAGTAPHDEPTDGYGLYVTADGRRQRRVWSAATRRRRTGARRTRRSANSGARPAARGSTYAGSQFSALLCDQLKQLLLRVGEFLEPLLHQRLFQLLHVDLLVDLGQHRRRRQICRPGW